MRRVAKYAKMFCLLCLLPGGISAAQSAEITFPRPLTDGFDYATFTRFDAHRPPKSLIYQSNGFMALQEQAFGGQKMQIPILGLKSPTNSSDLLSALTLDAPELTDQSGRTFSLESSPAERSLTYFADRTVYRAKFENGLQATWTVYPVYGQPSAVMQLGIEHASGPLRVRVRSHGDGLPLLSNNAAGKKLVYGSPKWAYRAMLAAQPAAAIQGETLTWDLKTDGEAALLLSIGGNEQDAATSLSRLKQSSDLFSAQTHRLWNEYLASTPLVMPADPVTFVIGTSGKRESIAPEELVRSELWFWRGLLNTTCQATYLPGCPMMIADWNVFMGMWSNDGIAEALAVSATNRRDLARASILRWFRYSVNAQGDGTTAWTIFPSGANTFQATGPERETQGVPVQATLVGEYIRMTGDTSILSEPLGGSQKGRTVWDALLAYQNNLLKIRDANHDHLIDWLHTYETGWDDKNSPFVDLKGNGTSAISEQVDNLWNLQEMIYLARLQGTDPSPWQRELDAALQAVHSKLWDNATQRYWDLDITTGKLWTKGENLDAYFLLYFEKDPARVRAMMERLQTPQKFGGALLPTLAFDTPKWGGYWRGPAWPRIFGYVAMALAHSGHSKEGFEWLSRAISSNLGPLLPETVDPKAYPPGEHANGSVRIMGYDALDTMMFPDVAGLRTWGGQDLTVVPPAPALGRVYIRNQAWMGDRYDAVFEPGKATKLWRNKKPMEALDRNHVWQAHKHGQDVIFSPVTNAE